MKSFCGLCILVNAKPGAALIGAVNVLVVNVEDVEVVDAVVVLGLGLAFWLIFLIGASSKNKVLRLGLIVFRLGFNLMAGAFFSSLFDNCFSPAGTSFRFRFWFTVFLSVL